MTTSLQKETILSVVIGLILGLFVTYGLYRLKQTITTASSDQTDSAIVTPSADSPSQTSRLKLTSPQDGTIQVANKVKVSGTAEVPESYVVIFVGNAENILQADKTGAFSVEVDLKDGANIITVIIIDENGQVDSAERLVAVSDVFEVTGKVGEAPEGTSSAEPQSTAIAQAETISTDDASPAAESTTQAILDRINKKVDEVQESDLIKTIEQLAIKRRAIVGRVTRVTDESITLDSRQGATILPIDENIKITKAGKTFALTSIAVGDWALVMGSIDDTTITPEYVMVSSSSLRPNNPFVVIGSLKEVGKTSVTVTNRADSQEMELTINKNTDYQDLDGKEAKFTDFVTDLTVLGVGREEAEDDKTTKILTTLRALAVFEN